MLTQNSSKLFNLCLGWGRRVGMGCGKDYCEHTALWWSKMGTVSLPVKAAIVPLRDILKDDLQLTLPVYQVRTLESLDG